MGAILFTAKKKGPALYEMNLSSTGTGTGVSIFRITVSSAITVTLTGAARFYTNAAGTTGESITWNVTAGALRTIYIKCTTGTAKMIFSDASKITAWGSYTQNTQDGWVTVTNSPSLSCDISTLSLITIRLTGLCTVSGTLPSSLLHFIVGSSVIWIYAGALPSGLLHFELTGANTQWTYTGALPSGLLQITITAPNGNWTYNGALPNGLTYLWLYGNSVHWTYTGELPAGLTTLRLGRTGVIWTYNGALPSGITYLALDGVNINWTYSGALPSNITYLYLVASNLAWTYSGALPLTAANITLNGIKLNWTGLDFTGTTNIIAMQLLNYRVAKMTSVDMVTMLTSLKNRIGTLPASIVLNDYLDYANPPQAVLDAKAALLAVKGCAATLGA
jgi:hypothetical protein